MYLILAFGLFIYLFSAVFSPFVRVCMYESVVTRRLIFVILLDLYLYLYLHCVHACMCKRMWVVNVHHTHVASHFYHQFDNSAQNVNNIAL